MDFSVALNARHSVRDFSEGEVLHEVAERVLEAAVLAPSSTNEQPWRFYVASGEARARVVETMVQSTVYLADYIDPLDPVHYEEATCRSMDSGGAPVAVSVGSPPSDDQLTEINRLLGIGAALENVSLAATGEGLGASAIGLAYRVRDELGQAFGVPDDWESISLIVAGYPAGIPRGPEHPHDVAVYRE